MATQTWETGLLPSGVEGWLSKITLPSGDEYLIRDDASRTKIQEILNDITGGVVYSGKSITPLVDQATTTTIKMTNGSTATVTANDAGTLVTVDKNAYGTFDLTTSQPADWTTKWTEYYTKSGDVYVPVTGDTAPTWEDNTYYKSNGDGAVQDKEFIWNGASWDEFGSVGALKTLAYMDPSDFHQWA